MAAFRDLALTADNDLQATDDGADLVAVGGVQSIAQAVRIMLRTFQGEWFADLAEGVPYLPDLLQNKATDDQVASVLRGRVLAVPGVTGIASLAIVRSGRVATVSIEVHTDLGALAALVASLEV